MTVFILGPAEWRDAPAVAIPSSLATNLPDGWPAPAAGVLRPIDLRAALVGALRAQQTPGTMMEMYTIRAGETHTALFQRIEREAPIRQYFVVWLPGCKRAGLDIEIGGLLARLARGEALDVRVFPHESAARVHRGALMGLERGQRTRYYGDLASYATAIVPWKEVGDLVEAVTWHAATPSVQGEGHESD